jgi:cytochrome b pre-mRNA-processing protein 3
MDASMREMGVGDLAVPKKMRRIGAAFYERQAEYRQALAAPDAGLLAGVLTQNVYAGNAPPGGAERLADYVRSVAAALATQDAEASTWSALSFPDPAGASAETNREHV